MSVLLAFCLFVSLPTASLSSIYLALDGTLVHVFEQLPHLEAIRDTIGLFTGAGMHQQLQMTTKHSVLCVWMYVRADRCESVEL